MRMTFRVAVIGGFLVFAAVVSVVVILPSLVISPDQTIIAHPYSDAEARGRKIFYSNGCNYCHTQYVREVDNAMGPISEAGNYIFDSPMILGSERTGPDLSYVGRKRSEEWEIAHLKSPRDYSPMSIMPSFDFLSDAQLADVAAYLFALGDRFAGMRMVRPPADYEYDTDPAPAPLIKPAEGDQGWASWTAANLQSGKEVYVDRCLTCHGCAGNGLGSYAQTLIITPANFKQEPFRSMSEDEWFWHVSEGVQGSVMPPWRESLSDQERWDVIRYIITIFAQPAMRDPAEGDPPAEYANLENPVELSIETLDAGKAIFTRECMVCHGDAGRGNGPYRFDLQPSPPDFGDGSYGSDYTDADYFWRISEGLPWSAMPSWKLRYSEEDRWKLVHYIRAIFTQTEDKPAAPPQGQDFVYPDFYKQEMRFPETVSYERGKTVFLLQCAHCHGLAGDGKGWDGAYLNPTPADFRDMAGKAMTPESEGEHLAKVTFGIQDTAMPVWGEWLPWDQRWDAIKYLMASFMVGQPSTESVYTDELPADLITLTQDNWTGEGHTIDVDQGKQLYGQYCATCHADDGQGNGPGTQANANGNSNASGSPAPFPGDMGETYIFWRIRDGVPDSVMPPFRLSFNISEGDIWNMTVYVQQLIGSGSGTKDEPTATPAAPAATPTETPAAAPQPTSTPGGGS